MCTCTDDKLCPEAEAWWTALNLHREGNKSLINAQYNDTKQSFTTHRTTVLREKGLIRYDCTTGYCYYEDWRERLLPTWKEN